MNRNLNKLISAHTTQWFHYEKSDSISPALSVKQFSELFLNACKRMKLTLTCTEKEFKNFMCEATCTMYVAHKRNTTWIGPLSELQRPKKWNSGLEAQWIDYIRFHYFTSDTWHNLWHQIPEGMWERSVPEWRVSMEHIVYHYIECQPQNLDDYSVDSDEKSDDDVGQDKYTTSYSKPKKDEYED
jgi:hypothetical protein